jgi:CXXX repeat radical SAM target protein
MKKVEEMAEIASSSLDAAGKINRRKFFINSAKMVIPTLGFLGLTLTVFSGKALAANCQGTCTGGCALSCTGGCAGECSRTCRDICANSCTVTAR